MINKMPAAFGRLCVETLLIAQSTQYAVPAAFGRLCVETIKILAAAFWAAAPAAFGRLCVETMPGCGCID